MIIVATHPASNLLTELFVLSNNRPFKHRVFNINKRKRKFMSALNRINNDRYHMFYLK